MATLWIDQTNSKDVFLAYSNDGSIFERADLDRAETLAKEFRAADPHNTVIRGYLIPQPARRRGQKPEPSILDLPDPSLL